MAVEAFQANQGTQTNILVDNTGGTAGTVIPVMKVSMDGQGTYTDGNLFQGTIFKINTLGTLPNIPGGTIGSIVGIGSVSGLSNLPGGTLNNIASGTINSATVTGNLGTIGTIGSIVGVGSVSGLSNLPQGSINVTAGTFRTNDTVDSGNSSTGTLAANGSFVGTGFDSLGYSAMSVYVYSDQSSAADGVKLEFSSDNSTWHDATMDTFTSGNAAPNDGQTFAAPIRARYARVVYVNGGTNQTSFIINTLFRVNPLVGDLIPVSDVPDKIADHAMLTKASIVGKTTAGGGAFIDVKVNPSGALQVDPANGTVQISAGTINLGTFNMASGTLNVGTVVNNGGTVAVVQNAGTLQTGANTIGNIGTLIAGTINSATVTGNLGTIGTLGLVNTVTAVSNLTNGSIVVTTGTIAAGTISNNMLSGTLNVGTVRQDARTTQNIVSFGTQVAFTGAGAATIVGSASVGSGTSLWVNDISLFNLQSGAGTFILGFGTAQQGTNVLLRAPIGTNSAVGVEKPYPKAVNAGMTNQDLVLSATGAGTVDLSLSYFISA